MRKLLAVLSQPTNYCSGYSVTVANSFEQAKALIVQAELEGSPFETLDLPVYDEKIFWQFLHWMRSTGRNYSFSVFGCKNTLHFRRLCAEARGKGFRFNT
jgi:hypothetical protein